jgi:nitronate monooxygenase
MRQAAQKEGDLNRMQAWAGQSAALARGEPAAEVIARIWDDVSSLLG